MSANRVFVEAHGGNSDGIGALSDLPIAHVAHPLPLESPGRRGKELPQSTRRAGKATVVMASALAESRKRWVQRLQETVAVCEVTERRALQQVVAYLQPDILIVDLALPGLRRVSGLRDIQRSSPSTKILALTETLAEGEGLLALKAGVKGYCARTIALEHLKQAVAAVQKGEIWVSRKLVPALVAELLSLVDSREREELQLDLDPRLGSLTARQRMIADLISRGACNKEIANRLKISERTVKAHLTEAFRNVGVSDRLQLALLLKGVR